MAIYIKQEFIRNPEFECNSTQLKQIIDGGWGNPDFPAFPLIWNFIRGIKATHKSEKPF